MTETIDLPIPKCPNCRLLTRLLREARDRIPDWQTGVNRELLAEIDAALEASKRYKLPDAIERAFEQSARLLCGNCPHENDGEHRTRCNDCPRST